MKSLSILVAAMTSVICVSAEIRPASAQPPRVAQADIDYEASGFVMPASGPRPAGAIAGLTPGGPVQSAGYQTQAGPGYVPPLASGGYGGGGYGGGQPVQYAPQGYAPQGYQPGGPSMPGASMQGAVQQVGFFGGGSSDCDSCGSGCSGCDGACGGGYARMMGGGMMYGGCDGACGGICGGTGSCGMGGCDMSGGGVLSNGGVLGKMYGGGSACGGCGMQGCGHCGGLSNLRHMCIFCRGDGCEACQMFSGASLLGILGALKPYTEAGRCSQRWYDLSVEALFLSQSSSGAGAGVITQRGAGPGGTPVIFGSDVTDEDLEAGVRISGAMIFGAGGNLEATYMGGQEWDNTSTAASPAVIIDNPAFDPAAPITPGNQPFTLVSGADLFSFISEFGTDPAGGFDDTDRSISQTVTSRQRFHSGEFNYRRRTVGPYCRFQGSWLFGMRYFRYDNDLGLNIVGLADDGTGGGVGGPNSSVIDPARRFFNLDDSVENNLFGAQIGGDLWYNLMPGIQLGAELKGMWMKNEVTRDFNVTSNSAGAAGGVGSIANSFSEDDGTLGLEFQAQLAYRLSHSWTFRSAYYLIAIDEIANPSFDGDFIRDQFNGTNTFTGSTVEFDSLVLNGFSFGAEYLW